RDAGYMGFVRGGDGQDLYFSAIENAMPQMRPQSATFGVYRVRIAGGRAERIFGYAGDDKDIEFGCCNASVAPNGAMVAYAANGDVRIHNLTTGTDRLFAKADLSGCYPTPTPSAPTPLPTGVPAPPKLWPSPCFSYEDPSWSPNSRHL